MKTERTIGYDSSCDATGILRESRQKLDIARHLVYIRGVTNIQWNTIRGENEKMGKRN